MIHFKNSTALIIGIPRKGWSASKSGSPVIMQAACAVKANSRNMSSVASRQAFISTVASITTPCNRIFSRNESRAASDKYLSNLVRDSVSDSSCTIGGDKTTIPPSTALSTASFVFDRGKITALTNTLVSITKRFLAMVIIFTKKVNHGGFVPLHQFA